MQFIGSLGELYYLSENMLLTMFTSALIREPFDLSFLKFPPMPSLLQFHITRKTVFDNSLLYFLISPLGEKVNSNIVGVNFFTMW